MTAKCPLEKYRGKVIQITIKTGGMRVMYVPMDCAECDNYDSTEKCCRWTKGADKD